MAGTPDSRKELAGARASFEPHHGEAPASRHVVRKPSPPKGASRRLESQLTETSQRYVLTHCHPGQARTVYPKPQSGGYGLPLSGGNAPDDGPLASAHVSGRENLDEHPRPGGRSPPTAYRPGDPRMPLAHLIRNMSLRNAASTRPEARWIGAFSSRSPQTPQLVAIKAVGRMRVDHEYAGQGHGKGMERSSRLGLSCANAWLLGAVPHRLSAA